VDASHMGPRFHRGTVGYDRDTLPNKSPATTRYPKLIGRGEFLEKMRAFIKGFGSPLFFENTVLNPLFYKSCNKEGYNLRILKSTQRCLK